MTDADSIPVPPGDPGSRGRLALVVAAAVDEVGGARRAAGSGVEVATQYRGGRVVGVRLSPDRVTVNVVASDLRVKDLADAVHDAVCRALKSAGEQRWVDVVVADVDLDPAGEA